VKIIHILSHKDQWIFEYPTRKESIEIKRIVSMFKEQFGAEFEEVNGPFVEVSSTAR
jgi:hypothetical protein